MLLCRLIEGLDFDWIKVPARMLKYPMRKNPLNGRMERDELKAEEHFKTLEQFLRDQLGPIMDSEEAGQVKFDFNGWQTVKGKVAAFNVGGSFSQRKAISINNGRISRQELANAVMHAMELVRWYRDKSKPVPEIFKESVRKRAHVRRDTVLITGDAINEKGADKFVQILKRELGPIMDINLTDRMYCRVINGYRSKDYLILKVTVPSNFGGNLDVNLGHVKKEPDVGWHVDRNILIQGIDKLLNLAKHRVKESSIDSAHHSYEKHSARRETAMRRFYDGIVSQENITIGDVTVPVVKGMAEYVRYDKQYGKNRYYMNQNVESEDCGVIFFDDAKKKVVAYSPPQWYFSGTAGYLA